MANMRHAKEKNDWPQQTQKPDTTSSKNKKGKKIVAGNSLRTINTANNQWIKINNKSMQNGDYKIPRKPAFAKPDRAVPPAKNSNNITGEKKHAKASKNTNTNTYTYTNKNNYSRIILHKDVDLDAVRAALGSKSMLPNAFSNTVLELNQSREFFIREKTRIHYCYGHKLRKILEKNHLPGWLEWLQGCQGWIQETDKSPYLRYYRDLYEVYDIKVRALMKEVDKDTKNVLRLLYYKDPLTLKTIGNGTQQNTNQQTLWKKANTQQSLYDAVGMIRPFLEVVRYFCTDPRGKWTSLPWLMPTVTQKDCKTRLADISNLVKSLMRSSDWGPDVPVHWAAHPPRNSRPLCVVTPAIMTELVVGVANILRQLFLCHPPKTVSNLDEVDALLCPSLWSASNTKKSAKKTTRTTQSTNHHTHPSASNAVDQVVIDLTGLSIAD